MKTPRLKFPLTLEIGGEPMTFIGRDMLVGWFFQGFPDPMPLTDCWKREGPEKRRELAVAMEAWHDQLLCRGVWIPTEGSTCRRLTPELVQRLGDQRDRAVRQYLSGLGWVTPDDKGHELSLEPLPRGLRFDDPMADAERRGALTRIPSKNLLAALTFVADRARTAPHVVWRRWGISEFIWTWRARNAEKEASQRAVVRGALPAEFAEIGIEA